MPEGPGAAEVALAQSLQLAPVDIDHIHVPGAPEKPSGLSRLKDAAHMLGELGVVSAIGQVAAAYTRTTFDPGQIADSLGAFAKNLSGVADKLQQVPGVSEALSIFGGTGAIAAGALQLKSELEAAREKGPSLSAGLGAAAAAAQLVGGVATALTPLCPALAGAGAAILTAGAALKLGKLSWDNRQKAGQAIGAAKIISNNAANAVRSDVARIVANNGANAVKVDPFAWMTG
jgi:hypothetical protein